MALAQTYSFTSTPLVSETSGSSYTFNVAKSADFAITLNASCTFNFPSGLTTGRRWSITLRLIQDGSSTTTWGASVKWPKGTAPTLTTTAAAYAALTFFSDNGGTTWNGFLAGDNLS